MADVLIAIKSSLIPAVGSVTWAGLVNVQYTGSEFAASVLGSPLQAAGLVNDVPFSEKAYVMAERLTLPVFLTRTLYVTVVDSLNCR